MKSKVAAALPLLLVLIILSGCATMAELVTILQRYLEESQ